MSGYSDGFTLVELIIAMTLLSFMLAIVSIGYLQIGKIYQSGVYSRRTQQTARSVMEDITREVRSATSIDIASNNRLCLKSVAGAVDYWRDNSDSLTKHTYTGSCGGSVPSGANTTVLVSTGANNLGLRATEFKNTALRVANNTLTSGVQVTLQIATQATDLLDTSSGKAVCKPGAGSQYCATTELTNSVSLRGVNND